MDEQKNQQNQTPVVPDYTSEINAMYDAQRQQQLQSLESAYNQNTQTLKNSLANNAKLYNERANDLSAQYERTRMNNNMRAASNGISTGAASQMDLAQQANYLNAFGGIRSAQADSEAAINQQIANLELTYKNAVSDAIANNDHERAAALLAEYKRRDEAAKEEQRYQEQMRRQAEQDAFAREQYNAQISRQAEQDAFTRQQYANSQALNKAQLLAQYGNFSGYAELYGQDVANAMQQYYDMMSGGSSRSSGSSGRSGGSSGGNGGSGGSSVVGTGAFNAGLNAADANNPTALGNSNMTADDFENRVLLAMQNNGGSYANAYDAITREESFKAQTAAMQKAISMGLVPNTTSFNTFVDKQANADLQKNPAYIAAVSAKNNLRADAEAKRQAQKSKDRKRDRNDMMTAMFEAAASGSGA